MTPITIRLFECLNLNPVPVLPFIILNVNIAGLTTLTGHPPNLLITNDEYIISKHNISFLTFTKHMSIGVIIALIQTNIYLRFFHRNIEQLLKKCPNNNDELKMWQKCLETVKQRNDIDNLKSILLQKINVLNEKHLNDSIDDVKPFHMRLAHLKKMVSACNLKF